MSALLLLAKNAIIGGLGGFIARMIDVARGKTVSLIQAVAKVLAGGFASHFFSPFIAIATGINDEGFISAIIGILGYKLIEYILSEDFATAVKDRLLFPKK